ncbi:MAG: polysaccharide biosynthesis C-terminal domain-containing protein [Clostridiales bacterium]|nr:polysaccharide biosynthesis C-terminal domain-containing protein [Clostridiales bacterium]MBR3248033.1 polysaccharide biosynthesis C-terminal domain-containing protein [Clostridiales bacterium]
MGSTGSRTRYLAKNTLIFSIGNIGSKLVAFFLVPLYTNALVTGQYGTADLITNICIVAAPVIFFNIGEAVMRFALDKNADINGIMSAAFLIMLCSLLPGSLLAFGILLYRRLSEYLVLILLYVFAMGISQIFFCYLRGKEQLLKYSIGNIIQALLIAVFNIVFLVVFDWGIRGYLLAYVLSYAVTAVYAFIAGKAFAVFRDFHIDRGLLKQMLLYSVVLIPNSFMWWIMNSSDRLMVIEMVSAETAGIYAVSYKLPTILAVMTGVFNQAYSYSAIKENDSKDAAEFNGSVFDAFFAFLMMTGMLILIVLKPFMSFYVEPEYYEAWMFSPPLIVGMAVMALGTFFSNFYVVNKDSKGFMLSATTGAVVNVVLNFVLIPLTGAMGAAIATCISYMAVFVFRFFDIRKYMKLQVFTVRNIVSFVLLTSSALLVYPDSIWCVFVQAALLIVLVVIRYKSIKSVLEKIVKGLGRK